LGIAKCIEHSTRSIERGEKTANRES
jgi:hypothetical protein